MPRLSLDTKLLQEALLRADDAHLLMREAYRGEKTALVYPYLCGRVKAHLEGHGFDVSVFDNPPVPSFGKASDFNVLTRQHYTGSCTLASKIAFSQSTGSFEELLRQMKGYEIHVAFHGVSYTVIALGLPCSFVFDLLYLSFLQPCLTYREDPFQESQAYIGVTRSMC